MLDLTPRPPRKRPLLWSDFVLDLAERLAPFPHPIYLVGGAVRDVVLGRVPKDLDLIVPQDSIRLARQIANLLNGDVYVMDEDREVARVLVETADGRQVLDVARFRGAELEADLSDRDFTINAMAVDFKSDLTLLIDPLGGEEDLHTKRLRRCSAHALTDDPIRALRAVRQSVQLGLRITPETLQDMRTVSTALAESSPERLRDELVNLLTMQRCGAALRIADTVGLTTTILPEINILKALGKWEVNLNLIDQMERMLVMISPARTDETAATFALGMLAMQIDRFRKPLQAHIETRWANGRSQRFLLGLAALLRHVYNQPNADHGDPESLMLEARTESLRLSNGEKARLLSILRHADLLVAHTDLSLRGVHQFWRHTGIAGIDICLLGLAGYLADAGMSFQQNQWLFLIERVRVLLMAYFEQYEHVVAPKPLLDGNQIMQHLAIQPGRIIGVLLEQLVEAQAAGDVHSREEAVQFVKMQYQAHTAL